MRFSLPRTFIIVLALSAAMPALGADSLDHNRFKWRDAQGNLHYSDTLPAEATQLGYEVVNPHGIIVKRVQRAKTPAELAAAKSDASKAAVEQKGIDARARSDEQLISGYPEESDLKRAQKQQLEMLNQQVVAAQISLHSQEVSLADLLGRAAEAERSGEKLPAKEAAQLADVRKQVDNQRLIVERREGERDAAGQQFEQQTARYRELKAAQSASRSQ